MKIAFIDTNLKMFSEYSRVLGHLLPEGVELVQFRGWEEAANLLFVGQQWKEYVSILLSEESGRLEQEIAQFCQSWNDATENTKARPSILVLFASSIRNQKAYQLPWSAGTSVTSTIRKNDIVLVARLIRQRLESNITKATQPEEGSLVSLGQLL